MNSVLWFRLSGRGGGTRQNTVFDVSDEIHSCSCTRSTLFSWVVTDFCILVICQPLFVLSQFCLNGVWRPDARLWSWSRSSPEVILKLTNRVFNFNVTPIKKRKGDESRVPVYNSCWPLRNSFCLLGLSMLMLVLPASEFSFSGSLCSVLIFVLCILLYVAILGDFCLHTHSILVGT